MNYFVCQCILDVVLTSNSKEITDLIESGFLNVNFLIVEEENRLYICCKESIGFCHDHSSNLDDKTCADVLEPISCFDLIPFGFENLCSLCKALFLKYCQNILVKIKK